MMDIVFRRGYRGNLKCAILDWAGTTMDYGVYAPAGVFLEVFRRQGVAISMEEARAPMGAHKKVHLQKITEIPAVARRWQETKGRPVGPADIEAMFADFVPLQLACLRDYSRLIPGTLQAMSDFKARRMVTGSTTGYTRAMVDITLLEAKKQGYVPDCTVAADEVPAGRPFPYACWKNAIELQVWPAEACVKIGDTVPDVGEGLNAGMWVIGLALTGNEVGLNEQELAALDPAERQQRLKRAEDKLAAAGAHYVAAGIWGVPPLIDDINRRLAAGERP
jgi:phosphonoacetaldehyde hydrolase